MIKHVVSPKTTNSFFELKLVFKSHKLIEKKVGPWKGLQPCCLWLLLSCLHPATLSCPKENITPLHHHFYKFTFNSQLHLFKHIYS